MQEVLTFPCHCLMDQIFLSSLACSYPPDHSKEHVKWEQTLCLLTHTHICSEHHILASSAMVCANIWGCLSEITAARESGYHFSDCNIRGRVMAGTPSNGAGSPCYPKSFNKLGIVRKQKWKVKPALAALCVE